MPTEGTVTAETARGPRFHQEDRYVVHPFSLPGGLNGHLLAVMDGHGGSQAADVCEAWIPGLFSLRGPKDLEKALRRVVAELDGLTRELRSGTSVSMACILESHDKAAIAILGDSPVVAVEKGGRPVTCPEHNVRTNLEERRRVESRGGVYEPSGYVFNPRTGHGLQLSRALGDRDMDDILGREPEIYTIDVSPESLVVLMTDGVIDPAHAESDQFVEELTGLMATRNTFDARTVIDWAEERGLLDNATAVVWKGLGAGPRRRPVRGSGTSGDKL